MKWIAQTLTIAGATLLAGNTVSAVIPDKYQTILDRNAFGLLPPPPPPPENTNAAPPPSNLKLTGFATINGERRVFFIIPPNPKDPKDVQQYINLAEGERQGSLEVIRIAETDGEVRINNAGTDTVLSLKKDGIQPAKAGPAGLPAPMPMANPAGQVSPVYNPTAPSGNVAPTPQPMPQPGAPPMPNQPNQFGQPQQNFPGNPQQNFPPGQQNAQPSNTGAEMRTIPTRTLRVPPIPQPAPQPAPQPQY